jgi:hypothetical protein
LYLASLTPDFTTFPEKFVLSDVKPIPNAVFRDYQAKMRGPKKKVDKMNVISGILEEIGCSYLCLDNTMWL